VDINIYHAVQISLDLLSYKKQTNQNFHVDINFTSNIAFYTCNSSTILYSEYIIYAILTWKVLAMKFLEAKLSYPTLAGERLVASLIKHADC
jgi:hypothetical protein